MSDKLFGSYGLPVSDREKPDTSKHKSDAEVGTAEDPISDELHNRHEHGHERQRSDSGTSTIDGLLFDIYDRWQYEQFRDSLDSDTFTEYSSTSDAFHGRVDSLQLDFRQKHSTRPNRVYLQSKCEFTARLKNLKALVSGSGQPNFRSIRLGPNPNPRRRPNPNPNPRARRMPNPNPNPTGSWVGSNSTQVPTSIL